MKLLLRLSLVIVFFSLNVYAQDTGINTTSPTKTLDVNGEVRIRTTNEISNTEEIRPLFVDSQGVVGTAKVGIRTTFLKGSRNVALNASSYNNGYTIVIPFARQDIVLNTSNNVLRQSGIEIVSDGIYSLSASTQIAFNALEDPGKEPFLYTAFQIQISTDNGANWSTLMGYRYLGSRIVFGVSRNHNLVLPSSIAELKKGSLLRLVIYRTRFTHGELQGVGASEIITSNSYGGSAYTLSVTKL